MVAGEPVAIGTTRKRTDEKQAEVKKMKMAPPADERMVVVGPALQCHQPTFCTNYYGNICHHQRPSVPVVTSSQKK